MGIKRFSSAWRRIGPQSRFHQGRGGAALVVDVDRRRAAKSLVRWQEGVVHIALDSGPADPQALERCLVDVLSRALDIPAARIEIVAHGTSTRRIVVIYDLTPQELERRLRRWR